MTAHRVTVDLGNSRLKLRAWTRAASDAAFERVRSVDLDGDPEHVAERVRAWIEQLRGEADGNDHAIEASVSCVASPSREAHVLAALDAVCDVVHAKPDAALEIRCRVPDLVGRDRLWAARGALELTARASIVVDVGTALTVDAVSAENGGVFLGGAIAPGPALLAQSLAEGAARLPRVEPAAGVPALGLDTEAAIRSGVVHGLRGAAAELARRIAFEAQFDQPALVLTGGARSLLLEPEPAFDVAPIVHEDLVHLGLLAAGFGCTTTTGDGATDA